MTANASKLQMKKQSATKMMTQHSFQHCGLDKQTGWCYSTTILP